MSDCSTHAFECLDIVRCVDCRYYDLTDGTCFPSEVYPDRYWCSKMGHYMQTYGFCAWGERRDA